MENKWKHVFTLVFVAVIFTCVGFFIGTHTANQITLQNTENDSVSIESENSADNVVGVYYTNDWNGHGATLLLNDDGTCKYPSSSSSTEPDSTWEQEDDRVYIDLNGQIYEAIIVENGLILHNALFQKIK